jgi:hypothetical protein
MMKPCSGIVQELALIEYVWAHIDITCKTWP